jgi:hypothetical protein
VRRARTIELSRPAVGRAEARAVPAVLRSGWLGLGRETARFETRFAAWVGARHCVATSSGTAALQLAVALLDLQPEDEVVVPAITFVATAHAVLMPARVVLADVSPDTLTLDPADLARKIGADARRHSRALRRPSMRHGRDPRSPPPPVHRDRGRRPHGATYRGGRSGRSASRASRSTPRRT